MSPREPPWYVLCNLFRPQSGSGIQNFYLNPASHKHPQMIEALDVFETVVERFTTQ